MSAQNRSWFFQIVLAANRFVNGDLPDQATFQNLTDSVTFKNESGDKATTSQQGLVKTVSDADAVTSNDPDSTYAYAAQPHQLPTVEPFSQTLGDLTTSMLSTTADVGTITRNKYKLGFSASFLSWLPTRLIPTAGSSGQVLAKLSGTNYDFGWVTSNTIPSGGATGTVLKKNSGTNYDASFLPIFPSFTANAGKVLAVNAGATDVEWVSNSALTNVPLGGIIMYDGSMGNFDGTGLGISTLTGWALCNGSNGTTDMTGMFAVNYKSGDADFGTMLDTGGAKTFTLIEDNLPPHAHDGTTDAGGAHSHTVDGAVTSLFAGSTIGAVNTSIGSGVDFFANTITSSTSATHTHTFSTDDGAGISTAVTHLQPYIVLAYIKRIV